MEKIKSSFYFDSGVKLIVHYQTSTFTIKHPPLKYLCDADTALECIDAIKTAIEFAKQVLEDDSEQYEMPTTGTVPIDNTVNTITSPTEQRCYFEFPTLRVGNTFSFTWNPDIHEIVDIDYTDEGKRYICKNSGKSIFTESELRKHWNALFMTVNKTYRVENESTEGKPLTTAEYIDNLYKSEHAPTINDILNQP